MVDATPDARGRRESLRFARAAAVQAGLVVALAWTAAYVAQLDPGHPAVAVASAALAGGCTTLMLDEARRRRWL